MTPEEHYAEAEALAEATRTQVNYVADEGDTFTPEEMNAFDLNLIMMSVRASTHAKLAEVGLAMRQAGAAAEQFGDEVSARNAVWAKLHDFGRPAPDSYLHCRKCGRCETHRGDECASGQENSTAKTCLVCIAQRAGVGS